MGILERSVSRSSAIKDFNYDRNLLTLEIVFKTGGVYTYHNVPYLTYEGLLLTTSLGRFFNSSIRDRFRVTRG